MHHVGVKGWIHVKTHHLLIFCSPNHYLTCAGGHSVNLRPLWQIKV
jgi:hypothetical protein